jgi:polyhydroxyalkanoate synthesis regulator phasin
MPDFTGYGETRKEEANLLESFWVDRNKLMLNEWEKMIDDLYRYKNDAMLEQDDKIKDVICFINSEFVSWLTEKKTITTKKVDEMLQRILARLEKI